VTAELKRWNIQGTSVRDEINRVGWPRSDGPAGARRAPIRSACGRTPDGVLSSL
jgi:hypothetical protein